MKKLIYHNPWNNLSMAEKAEMIGVAVRNGITSLPEIRAKYNEFAEGGKADTRYQHTEPDANLYAGGDYMEKAKAMIRANEGWRSTPYKDAPKGKNWRSVGYGFNDSGFWERYPEGISKHYENGITKAQAEKELDYFLGKAERQLKGIYGKRWNSFNDDQKAAILDTYYQRPASVGSKSGFYGAVMSGKDGAPYLGVQGFGDRNQSRRDLYRGRGISAPVSFESIAEPVPDADVTHFEPLNPQAFGMQLPTYQAPVIDTIDTTDKAATIDKTYDPAAIEKQERQDNLRRFGMFMSMLDGASGQDSGMPDFINMLAGKPMTYGKGGHLYDGTTENSQQMRNGKYFATNSRGDSYYISPSAIGASELSVTTPEVFVTANPDDVARGNAQRWWREHSNVYGEKGLEQVSPEFDLVSLSPLLKPVATKGLKIAAKGLSDVAVEEISSGLSHWNPARRAMEAAMQTSPNHNPLPEIWEGIGSMLRNKEFSRIKDIHNYILRGKPGRTGYNHFNKNASSIYTGLGGSENGYIRSLLYGEHPGGGLRFIGTADNIPVGEHFQTILDRGYKPKDIRVYETDVPYDYSFNPSIGVWDVENSSFVSPVKRYKYLEEATPFDEKEIEGLIKSSPAEGSFSIGSTGKLYDGQGHRLQYISDPDGGMVGAVRGQDFTDFNYTAYGNKWLPNKNNFLMRLGRKTVDKMTTPIIVRTPWGITEDLQNFLNWHRAFDWKQTGKYVPNDLFYIYALGGRKGVQLREVDGSLPVYDGTTENSQQMQQGYIRQRPEGSYFYDVQGQPAIDVTPLNTSLSDNPADWTFTDASGKIYNPHRETVKGTGKLSEAVREGPLVSAANNYFRELNWRMQNDPSSIALKGKYTMPLVFSPLLGQGAATALANPYVDAALTSGFGAHGLNHWLNEGINGWGDAAMTALELAPLGRVAKPLWNAITSTRNFIPTLESNMSGIRYAYNRNPELANIGTLEDYNDYLKTVFPESKVKDINYHMGPKGLQELKPSTGKVYNTNPDARGIYVTPDKSYIQKIRKFTTYRLEKPSIWTYVKRNLTPGGWDKANETFTDIYPVMVDAKNPLYTKGTWTWGIKDNKYRLLIDKYDAIVNSGPKWYQNINSMPETIVPKTEQTLILGSDADVAGFRRFMSNPQITAENAASMTPEQWTAAQDAAVARGDMAEAQRLRDLHFEVNAPNTKISNTVYHGTDETFNQFDRNKIGTKTDYGVFGEGFYFSPTIGYARQYGDNVMPMYLNIENPYVGVDAGGILSSKYIPGNPEKAYQSAYEVMLRRGKSVEEASRIANKHKQNVIDWNRKAEEMRSKGYDGIFANTEQMNSHEHQFVAFNPEQIKSADAVTYDDNGVRIPLGERDNFSINDIRYGLLPLGIGLTGYGFNE